MKKTDDTLEVAMILTMIGINNHHKEVIIVKSFQNPLNTIYIYPKNKPKIDVGPYISIDFKMFSGYNDFVKELKKNALFVNYETFEDSQPKKFRVRFRYPPNLN